MFGPGTTKVWAMPYAIGNLDPCQELSALPFLGKRSDPKNWRKVPGWKSRTMPRWCRKSPDCLGEKAPMVLWVIERKKVGTENRGLELKAQGRAGHWLMRRKPVNPFVKVNSTPFENIGITQDVLRILNRLLFATISLEKRAKEEKENSAINQHGRSDASLALWFMWIPKKL